MRDAGSENIFRKIPLGKIKSVFPEIHGINDSLLDIGVSLVFISIEKNRRNHIKELSSKIFELPEFQNVKVVVFLEHTIDISDIADSVWRFANNVDPKRDHVIIDASTSEFPSHVAFDGTRKTKEHDGFQRDWPNILASDMQTIKHVDEIWEKLGLGKFILSPSLKYRTQLYKGGAVVEE